MFGALGYGVVDRRLEVGEFGGGVGFGDGQDRGVAEIEEVVGGGGLWAFGGGLGTVTLAVVHSR